MSLQPFPFHLPLAEGNGSELAALLWPVTPAEFVHEYWGKKPLFVKGFPWKYAGFFDTEAFDAAIAPGANVPTDFLRASFDKKTPAGSSAIPPIADEPLSSVFRATLEQAVPLYDAGATLCVSQIEARVTRLAPFLAAIKRQLGYPGRACFNAYLSPPGTGFNWHFDSRIASTLQIEGTKRWRFSNLPATPWPLGNGTLRGDGTPRYTDGPATRDGWERLVAFEPRDTTEVVLEPGDLLILPAGVWHEACGGERGSLALNLTFNPISYTLLVRDLLDTLLTPEPGWRSPTPVLPGATAGEADPDGIAAISEQLARAADALRSLSGDSAAVVRLWESFVQNPNPNLPAPRAPAVAAPPVRADQRLRVRNDGNVCAMLADGGSRLCLLVANREIELTGPAVRFVQRMLAAREFRAADALAWADDGAEFVWSDVGVMLTSLLREGLLETA
jgi:hypothetical protein